MGFKKISYLEVYLPANDALSLKKFFLIFLRAVKVKVRFLA